MKGRGGERSEGGEGGEWERGIDRQGVVKREERGVRSIDRYEREEGKNEWEEETVYREKME